MKELLVDARTARTGGGITVLRVVEERLSERLADYRLAVRMPASFDHPMRPLVGPRTAAAAILGLSESSNVGWPHQPYVMLARNWKCWGTERSPRAVARRAIALRNGERASVVLSATNVFADAIRAALPEADVRTARFGVSEAFSPKGQKAVGEYVLSVGDLYRHKRFDLAIDAYAHAGISDDFELRIAGAPVDEQLFQELQEQVASHRLTNCVVFMGRVGVETLASLYRGAAATLLASDLESFGHPYVEAMASGCPIVGRKSAVADEITAGAASLVGADTEEMSIALETVLSADRDRAGLKGLERSLDFRWGNWIDAVEGTLREVS